MSGARLAPEAARALGVTGCATRRRNRGWMRKMTASRPTARRRPPAARAGALGAAGARAGRGRKLIIGFLSDRLRGRGG